MSGEHGSSAEGPAAGAPSVEGACGSGAEPSPSLPCATASMAPMHRRTSVAASRLRGEPMWAASTASPCAPDPRTAAAVTASRPEIRHPVRRRSARNLKAAPVRVRRACSSSRGAGSGCVEPDEGATARLEQIQPDAEDRLEPVLEGHRTCDRQRDLGVGGFDSRPDLENDFHFLYIGRNPLGPQPERTAVGARRPLSSGPPAARLHE